MTPCRRQTPHLTAVMKLRAAKWAKRAATSKRLTGADIDRLAYELAHSGLLDVNGRMKRGPKAKRVHSPP